MSEPDIVVVGSANVDLVVSLDELAKPGQTVLARSTQSLPGGKGSNQALAAARLGRRVALVGCVGDDDQAAMMRQTWASAGVDASAVRTVDEPTGQALCCVDAQGESSIVVIAGANGSVGADDVTGATELIASASVVLAQLEVDPGVVAAAAQVANGRFVLNAAPAQTLSPELLAATDVLMVNQTELQTITGLDATADDLAERLAEATVPDVVVITVGARGARAWVDGRLHDVPAPAVEAVDTTGAGDVLAGAFADALARGEGVVDATRWAVAAASLSVTSVGATSAQPSAEDVRRVWSKQG